MPDRLTFRPATAVDIPALRDLAERIWRVSYAGMLSGSQIDYMLDWMYGPGTIAAEIERGVIWVLAEHEGSPVGYLSLAPGLRAELHKLYLLPDLQGRGYGQAMLQHARNLAAATGAAELRLRVNKTNGRALRAYEKASFRIVDALVADIGGGFVMDDYVLSLPLSPTPLVKICGLSTPETLEAAIAAGADQIGFVFFPKSPRHLTLTKAASLAERARRRVEIVALTVDASDSDLDGIMEAVRPDWLQLHGRETPTRVGEVRDRMRRPVMKAIGIATRADLDLAAPFRHVADRLLFDAKPPKGALLPGGNGLAFDWAILRDITGDYMLSGGLDAANVAQAVEISGASAVDVSSGVEIAPGQKDPDRISAFVRAARQTAAGSPQRREARPDMSQGSPS